MNMRALTVTINWILIILTLISLVCLILGKVRKNKKILN